VVSSSSVVFVNVWGGHHGCHGRGQHVFLLFTGGGGGCRGRVTITPTRVWLCAQCVVGRREYAKHEITPIRVWFHPQHVQEAFVEKSYRHLMSSVSRWVQGGGTGGDVSSSSLMWTVVVALVG
jgi:hypothetical protein